MNCKHSFNFFSLCYQTPIEWETVDVTPVLGLDGKTQIPPEAIESVNQNKIGLKGIFAKEFLFHFNLRLYINNENFHCGKLSD